MNNKNFICKIIENDLKNKKYKYIKTRFAPEPNGYLHIGHAKSIYINFEIAKKYNGKCNLRFDDTNPDTEKQIYINSIKKDIKWLGYKWNNKEKYASDYFNIYYNYAIKLIKKGLAYIDELSINNIKKYRGTLNKPGINSPFRNRNIEENIFYFKQMKKGKIKEGKMCLRAKINMYSKNIILRDPIIYRIKYSKHYRTKNKWCIYPMYDFAHCIADSIEKITHSICTLEFQNNKVLYNWILKNINIKHIPKQYEFSKLNITYNITSKRKINILIKNKIIKKWNDQRLLSISGLKNKGYTSESIKNFCNYLSISKKNNLIDIKILEKYLRENLEKNTIRIMGVINPIKIKIINLKNNIIFNVPNHPKNNKLGKRKLTLCKEIYIDINDFKEKNKKNFKRFVLNKKIKLRYSIIIKAIKIIKNNFNNIKYIKCIYIKNYNKKINIIHWISKIDLIKTKFIFFNNILKNKNTNIKFNLLKNINKKSIIIKKGYIDKNILNFKNKIFQLEREGYFKIIKKNISKLILNKIVSLKNKKNFL